MSILTVTLTCSPHTSLSDQPAHGIPSSHTGVHSEQAEGKPSGQATPSGRYAASHVKGTAQWKYAQTSGPCFRFQSNSSVCTALQSWHLPNAYVLLNLILGKDFNLYSVSLECFFCLPGAFPTLSLLRAVNKVRSPPPTCRNSETHQQVNG